MSPRGQATLGGHNIILGLVKADWRFLKSSNMWLCASRFGGLVAVGLSSLDVVLVIVCMRPGVLCVTFFGVKLTV